MGSYLIDVINSTKNPKPPGWHAPMKDPTPNYWTPRPGGGTVYTAPRVPTQVTTPSIPAPPPNTNNPNAGNGGGGGNSTYNAYQKAVASAQAKADSAQKKAEKEALDRSKRENKATAALVKQQEGLLKAFPKQRDVKLANITTSYKSSDANLRKGYGQALSGLHSNQRDNDKSEGDSTFANVTNAIRERGDILSEVASNGGGETDNLRSQLSALRNYSTNQGEINRSFFDTLNSVNRSITSLNVDTATSRNNLWNQAEADRESAWANYYNQKTDTLTQITNIESSNTNVKSDSSEEYKKSHANSGKEAAYAASKSYSKKPNNKLDNWSGKGSMLKRNLTSSNRAATMNLGGPMKRAEGATLRKW
jgi:hypothetical protein